MITQRFDVWFAAILVLGGFEPLVGLRFARGRQGRWKKWSDVRISPRKNPSQLSKQRIVCASVGLGDPGLGYNPRWLSVVVRGD
ncbi:uncharacterized protein LOC124294122 isoform X2 [Neodiprion lecontei]|uniref:Uncharacterized protein LOC124294122 isoform X2 n=1 Tax=Neodiprion lecontei TaxID=441921 RepID=A0ABM3G174_NEOLC|nr:uncharacterized protein LOC124294122 isoform X2 [Neodiprion lecontei]